MKDDYPIVLTANEIMEILSIGRRKAYQLMDQEGFPCIKIGPKLKLLERDAFFAWMNEQGK